jgi:hypothetical protein
MGTNSCASSSRLGCSATARALAPVRLPPGRFRLTTSPYSTGSTPLEKTIGTVLVAAFAASAETPGDAKITAAWRLNQVGRQRREAIVPAFRPAVFDRYVPALDKAGLAQALAKRTQTVIKRHPTLNPSARHAIATVALGGERPRCRVNGRPRHGHGE